MKKHIHTLGLCIALLSCETVVDVEIPQEDPRLVVNAILETDSLVRVHLSHSRSTLSSQPIENVGGAEILLFQNGQQVASLEEERTNGNWDGWYRGDYAPQAGNTYTLRASRTGYETVEADTEIDMPVGISKLNFDTLVLEQVFYVNDSPVVNRFVELKTLSLSLSDPSEEDNYYEIAVFQDAVNYRWNYNENGEIFPVDTLNIRYPAYLSTEDPAVVSGDFFSGDGEYYGQTLRFSDETFNGRDYTIDFDFQGSSGYTELQQRKYIVTLRSLNREQYLYLKSLELQGDSEGNPFAEPVPVYNNILGGYGIFTGFSQDIKTISLDD